MDTWRYSCWKGMTICSLNVGHCLLHGWEAWGLIKEMALLMRGNQSYPFLPATLCPAWLSPSLSLSLCVKLRWLLSPLSVTFSSITHLNILNSSDSKVALEWMMIFLGILLPRSLPVSDHESNNTHSLPSHSSFKLGGRGLMKFAQAFYSTHTHFSNGLVSSLLKSNEEKTAPFSQISSL
jgi:hypothetical protein